jgi:hypothetical protein
MELNWKDTVLTSDEIFDKAIKPYWQDAVKCDCCGKVEPSHIWLSPSERDLEVAKAQAKATWEARQAEIDALKEQLDKPHAGCNTRILEEIAKQEVAYKAGQKSGRQEVVDYVANPQNYNLEKQLAEWQAKLKEWGYD